MVELDPLDPVDVCVKDDSKEVKEGETSGR